MVAYAEARGDVVFSSGDPVEESIREAKSQDLEAVWDVQLSKQLKKPEKRAEMIAWIESQTGRPLPLDPDQYGRERAQTRVT
jgi:hypothetical protein